MIGEQSDDKEKTMVVTSAFESTEPVTCSKPEEIGPETMIRSEAAIESNVEGKNHLHLNYPKLFHLFYKFYLFFYCPKEFVPSFNHCWYHKYPFATYINNKVTN